MKYFLILVVFVLGGLSSLRAQNDTISVVAVSNWPSSSVVGDTIPIIIDIRNDNAFDSLVDPFTLIFARDTNGVAAGGLVITDSINQSTLPLAPGDTAFLPVNHIFRPAYYAPGNNVVVIWPISSTGLEGNGLTLDVWLDEVLGIREDQRLTGISVFPNPSSDVLRFKDLPNGQSIIKLYTPEGKLVQEQQLTSSEWNISHIKSGIYYLVLENNDLFWSEKIIVKREPLVVCSTCMEWGGR